MKAPAKPRKAPVKPSGARAAAGEVRLIGGQWKRTKLPVADKPGLRPTPDRVRETLFNWLGQDLTGWRCVDAFAGTGALGLEAASRGAAQVQLVEQDAVLVQQLNRLKMQLHADGVQVTRGDGLAVLRQLTPASIDLIFLDPPFEADLFDAALQAAAPAVAEGGYLYLEAPRAWVPAACAALGLTLYRHLQAGAVHAHLLQRARQASATL